MAIKRKFIDELEGKTATFTPKDYVMPMFSQTGINREFVDSLVAGEHKDVQENKAKGIGFVESAVEEFARPAKGAQYIPGVGGVVGAAEQLLYLDAGNRLTKGFDYSKPIRPEQIMPGAMGFRPARYTTKEKDTKLIEDFILRTSEQQERGYTFGGKVAKGLLNLPTWMAEFAMTGGIANLGSTASKKAGEKLIGRWATTKAGQLALKTAGWTGGAITRATLGLAPRIGEKALERQVNVQILGAEQEGWATSFAKAWGDITIEAASETAGQAITGVPVKLLSKTKFGGKFLNALRTGWMKATGGKAAMFAKKMASKGGYSNLLGEYGEERLASILRALTDVDDFGAGKDANVVERLVAAAKQDFEPTNIAVEFTVLGAIPAGQVALGTAGRVIGGERKEEIELPKPPKELKGPARQIEVMERGVEELDKIREAGGVEALTKYKQKIEDLRQELVDLDKEALDLAEVVPPTKAKKKGLYVEIPPPPPAAPQIDKSEQFKDMSVAQLRKFMDTTKDPELQRLANLEFRDRAKPTPTEAIAEPEKPAKPITKPEAVEVASVEDIEQLDKLVWNQRDFNKKRVSKKRQAEIIEESKELRRQLVKKGYSPEYIKSVEMEDVGLPMPPTAQPEAVEVGEVKVGKVAQPLREKIEKQPYEMNKNEFAVWYNDLRAQRAGGKAGEATSEIIETQRKAFVEDALSEGKPVPAEVLAEYPDLKPPTEAKPEAGITFKEGESAKGRPTLTALKDGKPVGKVIYEKTDEGVRIQNIDVIKEYRRQGIGTALVEQIKEKFPGKVDYTMPSGPEAKAFLEKVAQPEAVEVAPEAKQPWEMTKEEFHIWSESKRKVHKRPIGFDTQRAQDDVVLKGIVRRALEQGKPVPAEVLAEYPELKPPTEAKAEVAKVEKAEVIEDKLEEKIPDVDVDVQRRAKTLDEIREAGKKKADTTVVMPKDLEDENQFRKFVEQFTRFRGVGFPAVKAQKAITKRLKKFAQVVSEFKLNPTFTFDKESGQLVFKDRYRFGFHPEVFGLDSEILKDGQTVRFDLDSFGIKQPTAKKLKEAELFLGEPKVLGRATKKPIPVERLGKKEKPRKMTKAEETYEKALVDIEIGKREEVPGGVIEHAVTEEDIRRVAELGRKAGRQGWTVERDILYRQDRGTADTKVELTDAIKTVREVFSEKLKAEQVKPKGKPGFVDLTPIAEAGQQIRTTGQKAQKIVTRFTGIEPKVQKVLIEYEEQLRGLPKEAAREAAEKFGKLTDEQERLIENHIENPKKYPDLPKELKTYADKVIQGQKQAARILEDLGYPANWPDNYIKRLQNKLEKAEGREIPDLEQIKTLKESIEEARDLQYLHHQYNKFAIGKRVRRWFGRRISKKPTGLLGRKIPTYEKAEELGLERAPLAVSYAHMIHEARRAEATNELIKAINKNPELSAFEDKAPEDWVYLDEKIFPESVQRQAWVEEGKPKIKFQRRKYPTPIAEALEELTYSRGNELIERWYDKVNFALKIIGFYNPLVMTKNDLVQMWRSAGTIGMVNPKHGIDAIKTFATKNKEYQMLRKAGLFNNVVNYTPPVKELTQQMLDKIRLSKSKMAAKIAADWLNPKNIFKDLRRFNEATTWNMDEIIRIACWNAVKDSKLLRGMTEFEKVAWVNDAMVNYGKMPKSTKRWLGKIFFVPTYRIGNFRFFWNEVNRSFHGQWRHMGPLLRTVAYKMFVQWGFPALIAAAIFYKTRKKEKVWTERGYRIVIKHPETGKETVYALSDPLLEGAKLTQRPFTQTIKLNLAPLPSLLYRVLSGPQYKKTKDPFGEFFKLGTPLYRDILNWKDPDKTVPQKILTQLAIAYVYTRESKKWTEKEAEKAKKISADSLAKALSIWTDWRTQVRELDRVVGVTNLEIKFMDDDELKDAIAKNTYKSTSRKQGWIKGGAHKGSEKYVNKLKAELAGR